MAIIRREIGTQVLLAAVVSVAMTGCQSAEEFMTQLNAELSALKIVVTGGKSPLVGKRQTQKSIPPSPAPEMGEAARKMQRNRELLQEIFRVVLLQDPRDLDFADYADVMNQGASLEGLYNGFTHSGLYRRIETSSGVATASSLKHFGEVLAILEMDLPAPTVFDAAAAQPLPVLGHDAPPVPRVVHFPQAQSSVPGTQASPDPAGMADAYSRQFVGASVFTLKRILGDEALKVVASKNAVSGQLPLWYSKWVVRMRAFNVDFGLELRNRADEKFHYDWAAQANEDLVIWEVLNRVHRVINAAESAARK